MQLSSSFARVCRHRGVPGALPELREGFTPNPCCVTSLPAGPGARAGARQEHHSIPWGARGTRSGLRVPLPAGEQGLPACGFPSFEIYHFCKSARIETVF